MIHTHTIINLIKAGMGCGRFYYRMKKGILVIWHLGASCEIAQFSFLSHQSLHFSSPSYVIPPPLSPPSILPSSSIPSTPIHHQPLSFCFVKITASVYCSCNYQPINTGRVQKELDFRVSKSTKAPQVRQDKKG